VHQVAVEYKGLGKLKLTCNTFFRGSENPSMILVASVVQALTRLLALQKRARAWKPFAFSSRHELHTELVVQVHTPVYIYTVLHPGRISFLSLQYCTVDSAFAHAIHSFPTRLNKGAKFQTYNFPTLFLGARPWSFS